MITSHTVKNELCYEKIRKKADTLSSPKIVQEILLITDRKKSLKKRYRLKSEQQITLERQ